eukprot:764024-Hanusia_phi.AAC.1
MPSAAAPDSVATWGGEGGGGQGRTGCGRRKKSDRDVDEKQRLWITGRSSDMIVIDVGGLARSARNMGLQWDWRRGKSKWRVVVEREGRTVLVVSGLAEQIRREEQELLLLTSSLWFRCVPTNPSERT